MRGCLAAILVVAGLLVGCKPKADPASGELRIITLTPSSTELVVILGAGAAIVGVDKYSATVAGVGDLPTVGDFMSPNFAAMVRLRPSLVVGDALQAKAAAKLTDAGIASIFLPMHSVEDVTRGVLALGKSLNLMARARQVVADLQTAMDQARRRAAARSAPKPRVLVVMDREVGGLGGMTAAGPGTYADELLTMVGGENALGDANVLYPKIGAEQILRANPDVIIEAVHGGGSSDDWKALTTVSAVRNRAIFAADSRQYTAPSPRLGEALVWLEQMIYRDAP